MDEVGSCKGTFYKHYVDKYDLSCKCLNNSVYSKISLEVLTWEEFIYSFLKEFEKNAKVIVNAFSSNDINSARHFCENTITDVLSKIFINADGDYDLFLNKYSLELFGITVTDIIYKWLKNGKKESKEQVMQLIKAVMPNTIYSQIYNK